MRGAFPAKFLVNDAGKKAPFSGVKITFKIENTESLASWEGTGSYSMSPVELKPNEVIIKTIAVQVPSNEDLSNLYFVYNIRGEYLTYSDFGRIKVSR